MTTVALKEIPLDNDYEFEVKITRKNTNTGLLEPASGLVASDFRFWLSATDAGTAISGSLTATPTERSAAPGVYFGIILGSDITAQLASMIGATIYEVFLDNAADHVYSSIARRVVKPRRPT